MSTYPLPALPTPPQRGILAARRSVAPAGRRRAPHRQGLRGLDALAPTPAPTSSRSGPADLARPSPSPRLPSARPAELPPLHAWAQRAETLSTLALIGGWAATFADPMAGGVVVAVSCGLLVATTLPAMFRPSQQTSQIAAHTLLATAAMIFFGAAVASLVLPGGHRNAILLVLGWGLTVAQVGALALAHHQRGAAWIPALAAGLDEALPLVGIARQAGVHSWRWAAERWRGLPPAAAAAGA